MEVESVFKISKVFNYFEKRSSLLSFKYAAKNALNGTDTEEIKQ